MLFDFVYGGYNMVNLHNLLIRSNYLSDIASGQGASKFIFNSIGVYIYKL